MPCQGPKDAIAKAGMCGDIGYMETTLASHVAKRVKENGLPNPANAGNAKQPIRRAGTILQRLGEIVEDLISTNELGRIHTGRRLERINARHRTSPSAFAEV